MLNHDAAIHDGDHAARDGAPRRLLVHASELEPQCRRPRSQRVVDDARELLISPEYVDDVHPTGNLLQPAIDLLSEDRFFARVDGDHVVSAVEQIPTDAVGIAMRLGREPDDGERVNAAFVERAEHAIGEGVEAGSVPGRR